jgi:hypothetical protein
MNSGEVSNHLAGFIVRVSSETHGRDFELKTRRVTPKGCDQA